VIVRPWALRSREKTRNPQASYLISDCNPVFQLL
jgi:hypothetical protein